MEVRGRDQVAGLPKTISLTSGEITEAMSEPLAAIIGVIRQTLEKTPPELAADIIDRGMVLSGGGAQLRNIDRLVTKETGARVRRRAAPGVRGAGRRPRAGKLRGHAPQLADRGQQQQLNAA